MAYLSLVEITETGLIKETRSDKNNVYVWFWPEFGDKAKLLTEYPKARDMIEKLLILAEFLIDALLHWFQATETFNFSPA